MRGKADRDTLRKQKKKDKKAFGNDEGGDGAKRYTSPSMHACMHAMCDSYSSDSTIISDKEKRDKRRRKKDGTVSEKTDRRERKKERAKRQKANRD